MGSAVGKDLFISLSLQCTWVEVGGGGEDEAGGDEGGGEEDRDDSASWTLGLGGMMLCVIPNALILDFVFLSQQTHLYILPSALSVLMIINVLEFLSVKNKEL